MTSSTAYDGIVKTIRVLTGQANIITVPRVFVELVGSLDTALFLAQLLYWSDRGSRTDGFIYKSRREWTEETCLTDYAVRKASERLQEMGLLETKLHRAQGAPTIHYRLNEHALVEQLTTLIQQRPDLSKSTNGFVENNKSDLLTSANGIVENDKSLTEPTTEPTHQPTIVAKPQKKRIPSTGGTTEGQRFFLEAFGAKRFRTNIQKNAVLELEKKYGTAVLKEGIEWAATLGMSMGRAVVSLETALPKWGTKGQPTVKVRGV